MLRQLSRHGSLHIHAAHVETKTAGKRWAPVDVRIRKLSWLKKGCVGDI